MELYRWALCFATIAYQCEIVQPAARKLKRSELMKELLKHYDKSVAPNFDDDEATEVLVNILVGSIDSINERTMDYDISIFLRQSWFDNRLKFGDLINDTMLTLDASIIKDLWVPDTFFTNEKSGHIHDITLPNRLIRLYEDGRIYYSTRISITLSCPMVLHKFPMDVQKCVLAIESFAFTEDRLVFKWADENSIEINPHLEFPQFDLIDATATSGCQRNYSTGRFSCLEVNFTLKRNVGFYVFQTYVPSCLIVMLSWVSFWIHVDAIPARISLGVITILAMITQTSGVQQSLPRVSYVKAIDVWMSTCLLFVFTALLEFAIVNVYSRKEIKQRTKKISASPSNDDTSVNVISSGKENIADNDIANNKEETKEVYITDPAGRVTARRIDSLSRQCFPGVFAIFNVVYWTVYCVVRDETFR
ncbi:glycine receptor subunit alpha-2-like [Tubulanus polymorphus]|uniref:glycine receptor subunit alpha-2-like n=1 Tax=Tubulanus polymorphus TaxID=672921 RepID=UPI003DA646F1